jgi:hypothetical protein
MKITACQTLLIAAGVAGALWAVAPAVAADAVPPAKPATGIAIVRTASAPAKYHHVWSRHRLASWYISRLRYADAAPSGWQSYSRSAPVLLMVGIAF